MGPSIHSNFRAMLHNLANNFPSANQVFAHESELELSAREPTLQERLTSDQQRLSNAQEPAIQQRDDSYDEEMAEEAAEHTSNSDLSETPAASQAEPLQSEVPLHTAASIAQDAGIHDGTDSSEGYSTDQDHYASD